MMTLPGTTLEEKFRQRNAAINAVAAYSKFQEGGAAAQPRRRPPTRNASPIPAKEAWHQALDRAKLSVYQKSCFFVCKMLDF